MEAKKIYSVSDFLRMYDSKNTVVMYKTALKNFSPWFSVKSLKI